MNGDDIRLLEHLVPRDECGAHFSRASGCEILAPGNHLPPEGIANRSTTPRFGEGGRSLCDWSSDVCSSDLNISSLETSVAPTCAARPVVRFCLQAITFIPKALP